MSEIIFDKQAKKHSIHSAIDKVDDTFYFGFQLPIRSAADSIDKNLCFIPSNKDAFVVNEDNLAHRNLQLLYPTVIISPKWDTEDMRNFLQSDTSSESYFELPYIIAKESRKYLVFVDKRTELLTSLWIIGTYLQPIWDSYPYLSISGTKRSGKTKTLEFIKLLAFNSLLSASISTAQIYRLIESTQCTFLLDESQKYSSAERQEEIRNILNAGYKKGASVFRTGKTSKGKMFPERFEVFSPKAIVSYTGLEDILEDRCIPIIMIRSKNKKIVNKSMKENDAIWQNIRNRLYRFALDKWNEIESIYQNQEIEVEHEDYMSRERELWQPILILASYFKILNKISPYIIDAIDKRQELERMTPIHELLKVLYHLVNESRNYTNAEIRTKAAEMSEDGQIPVYMTPQWIGATLIREFNVSRGKREAYDGKRSSGYYLEPKQIRRLCITNDVDIEISKDNKLNVLLKELEKQ